jgi:hypothetical protein
VDQAREPGAARRRAPAIRRVYTYNADVNRWMVAVNEAMGFRPQYRLVEWELAF